MTGPFPINFLHFGWIDAADVLLVTVLLYQLYKLLRGSVALNVALGLVSFYLLYLVVKATGMELLTKILGQFMSVGVLASIILFQQEIRRFLLNVGKATALERMRGWAWGRPAEVAPLPISPFVEAAKSLSNKYTGALICFTQASDLTAFAESGDRLDAEISKRLLLSIFNKTSPLHDGAVIVSNGRLRAARCILPVSENPDVPASLGLRHRAAIGLSEITDAVVLVVSEETGAMSLVRHGEVFRNLGSGELRARLNEWLLAPAPNAANASRKAEAAA
ncbi:diadenylate cyclase CdaA [Hymenobacter negativus]|uniref:Diadenylate cyclase n=1 Tax=Hymenobacter negativus TaxID=2795026 RepID=A0ABS0QBI1_9BACT|nr:MULTISPECIES: diadenylate cyclase CdaA [Bacteria]MBH8559952.1 TIGR00159 family protein [Hymenobacter negativus]MBH8570626.1 TIGR00159 family protein [Hymenobacter negativus]MBR7210364.1 diadenylate cyclase CdaA [Microvirga sp. STS02]